MDTSSRDIVRVAGEYIAVGTYTDSALTSTPTGWKQLVAGFIAIQDVKPSSRALYARTLSRYFQWLEDTGRLYNFFGLTRRDVLDYKDSLMGANLSDLTINSYIVAVRKFYEWCEAEKKYANIAKGVKVQRKKRSKSYRKLHLTVTEVKDLLAYEQEAPIEAKEYRRRVSDTELTYNRERADANALRNYAIVNLMLRCGLRTIEVVRANIEDITFKKWEGEEGDTHSKRVLMIQGKGRDEKDDFVALTEKAYEPIRDYLSTRKGAKAGEPLFTSTSRQNQGERLTTRTISGICKDGLRGIGLDGKEYTAHSLRHTTASTMAKKGASIEDIQEVMRHRSPNTSQIYIESIKEELKLEHRPEAILEEVF